jgi:hypothetical protein
MAMARFVYLGPPDESVASNHHALTGDWITGEPRDIDDAAAATWLRRHPHWRELVEDEPAPVDTNGDGEESREELQAALAARGQFFDRRWGIARLRAALEG